MQLSSLLNPLQWMELVRRHLYCSQSLYCISLISDQPCPLLSTSHQPGTGIKTSFVLARCPISGRSLNHWDNYRIGLIFVLRLIDTFFQNWPHKPKKQNTENDLNWIQWHFLIFHLRTDWLTHWQWVIIELLSQPKQLTCEVVLTSIHLLRNTSLITWLIVIRADTNIAKREDRFPMKFMIY